MKALPKRLYGYLDGDEGDEFVNTNVDPNTCVKTGEQKRVGVYELVGYATIRNETFMDEPSVKPRKKSTSK